VKRILGALLIAAASLVTAHAYARTSVPIVNHENMVVTTTSGRTPTQADVAKAIQQAAASVSWQVSDAGPGKMVATLVTGRGKHTVTADISYTAQAFSVKYRSSVNMNYAPAEGSPGIIHPKYNQWVQSLVEAIRVRTSSL
jgi:hypothetical protein